MPIKKYCQLDTIEQISNKTTVKFSVRIKK